MAVSRDVNKTPLTNNEKKKLIIRLIFFLVFFVGGLVAIGFGVSQCSKRKEGIYLIEANPDQNVSGFDNGSVALRFYIAENANDVFSNVTKIYTEELRDTFASCSTSTHYNAHSSMYDILTHLGEEVELSSYHYDMLKEAYQYSLDYDNYSLFNGPIYQLWTHIFTFEDDEKAAQDPLNNDFNKNYLQDLIDIISDESNYSLIFNDNANKVTLNISDTYKDFIANRYFLEEQFPIISFNVLEDVYKMEHIAKRLVDNGYSRGYIENMEGVCLALGGQVFDSDKVIYNLYNHLSPNRQIAHVDISSSSSIMIQNRRFERFLRVFSPYYSFNYDGNKIHRNYYIDTKIGTPYNDIANLTIFTKGLDLVKAYLTNNELNAIGSIEEINLKINFLEDNYMVCYTLFDENKNIYIRKNLKDYINTYESLDYNLINL